MVGGEVANPGAGAAGDAAAGCGELEEVASIGGIRGRVFPVGVGDGDGSARTSGVGRDELVGLFKGVVVAEAGIIGEGVDRAGLVVAQGNVEHAHVIDSAFPVASCGPGITSNENGAWSACDAGAPSGVDEDAIDEEPGRDSGFGDGDEVVPLTIVDGAAENITGAPGEGDRVGVSPLTGDAPKAPFTLGDEALPAGVPGRDLKPSRQAHVGSGAVHVGAAVDGDVVGAVEEDALAVWACCESSRADPGAVVKSATHRGLVIDVVLEIPVAHEVVHGRGEGSGDSRADECEAFFERGHPPTISKSGGAVYFQVRGNRKIIRLPLIDRAYCHSIFF